MKIREAKPEDVHSISGLIMRAVRPHREQDFDQAGWDCFVASNGEAGILAKLSEEGRATLVAEQSGQLLGLISVTGGEKIDLLFVCPNHRRKGVATGLWQALLKLARIDLYHTEMWVRSSSVGVPFYEKQGFAAEGGRQSRSGITFYLMKRKSGR